MAPDHRTERDTPEKEALRRARATARHDILFAALPHIAFDGWTNTAMERGAEDAGLDAVDLARFYPGGVKEIFATFSRWTDLAAVEAIEKLNPEDTRLSERIEAGILARLDAMTPHREAVRRGVTWLALPGNGPTGLRALHKTVDDLWYAAGDRSPDFSYYTKRATLAAIWSATVLYWLDDKSEDFTATHAFVRRRLADIGRIAKARGRLEKLAGNLPDPGKLAKRWTGARRPTRPFRV